MNEKKEAIQNGTIITNDVATLLRNTVDNYLDNHDHQTYDQKVESYVQDQKRQPEIQKVIIDLTRIDDNVNNDGGDNSEDGKDWSNEETDDVVSGSDHANFMFANALAGQVPEENLVRWLNL